MEGFKVRCRTCGAVLYETTEKYTCHKPLSGDMLRLLPRYKDWPTYDGSLAVSSTSRFLMFCSNCAGYISTTGKLTFVDFPERKVTEISKERSELMYDEEHPEAIAAQMMKKSSSLISDFIGEATTEAADTAIPTTGKLVLEG